MLNFQEMIAKLTEFWAEQGCVVHQGYDLEVGAGTFNPATFLRCQGPEPYAAVYVEPSRRPKDGRYGENPNRVQFYHQMQVIMKPSPPNIQDLYLKSLESIGFNLNQHDIRFVHDDWENPTIGAWGLGWEIWADGMEVSQFTYFQAVGGLSVKPVSGEITYGLERLAMYLQGVDSMFDLKWNDKILYGDVFKRSEWEWSHYNFKDADTSMWFRHFEDFEKEAKRLMACNLPIPAYDFVMKASHAFNILDARGVISVTERTGYIGRIRALAKQLAEAYLISREEQGFPLMRHHAPVQATKKLTRVSTKWSADEKEDFLLEIGSEELPATFVPIGLASLEREVQKLLKDNHLSYETLHTYGTPRRLAIMIKGLKGGTLAQTIEKKGPAVTAAFDEKGELTKAGAGFFRSLNLAPLTLGELKKGHDSLSLRQIQGVDYLYVTLKNEGKSTREILDSSLPDLILAIDFPKKMRWGTLDIEYARPLRWIVSLYGSEEIPFAVGDCVSGRTSMGHRQLANREINLLHAKDYLEALKAHYVMADIQERKQTILNQLSQIEKNLQGQAEAQERVLPQVLHLAEWPELTVGSFDPQYLEAPKEVLISEMVEHQKYFPISDAQGKLLPKFIIVCNNTPSDTIRKGNQKALAPRLADGFFLYREDLKVPLEHYNQKLKTITFQKDLGSMAQKVERIQANVQILYSFLPICDLNKALRAALLCKADLATELVGEFPDLQGIVGRLYALKSNEDPEVAQAIDEHWMPKGEKSPLPQTSCGILVSIAEKIDNLLSCFALGMQPTSSSDPYALRRQALGMLKMLLTGNYSVSLHTLFAKCFECFILNPQLNPTLKPDILKNKERVIDEILQFLVARLRTIFADLHFGKDEIEAVLSKGVDDISETYRLLAALHDFRTKHHEQFLTTLEVYTRCKKILFSQNPQLLPKWRLSELKGETQSHRIPSLHPDHFRHTTEKELYKAIENVKSKFHPNGSKVGNGRFALLSELSAPVAALFDAVKIIDEDPAIRTNRLALLQEIWDLCEELVDFSKIQEHAD